MTVDAAAFNEEDFDQLRANVEAMTIVSELRRQIIGGISEDDVKQCINTIQHHYQDAEKALLDKIEALESYKRKIMKESETLRQENEAEKAALHEKLEVVTADLSDYQTRCQ
ncbi:MAG TPA: hypothetical protein DER60_00565, partial [Syntrophomonas sp.]|nr:hypothetical protein [Syntrophomonas sp.]